MGRWSVVVLVAAVAVCILGVWQGTYSAAASDAYGYVSQADLIARGALRVDQSWARGMPWPDAHWSFTPPGYKLSPDRNFLVPLYSTGLPLVMAIFQRVSGTRDAVFVVVPLLGALAVWMTGVLGTRIHRPSTGALAAVLLAASPSFLYQLVQPASDVATTAWWVLCLALTVTPTRVSAVAAGLAAAMAILTRPNLVPLAAGVGLFYLWRAWRAEAIDRRRAIQHVALFTAGAIPGCLAVAALNTYLNGSPMLSGYGSLSAYFGWAHAGPNLDRYPRWLLQTETPFIVLGLLAPIVFARRAAHAAAARVRNDHIWLLLAFSAVVCVPYIFYAVFEYENVIYLRFWLPAFPALLVLSVAVVQQLIEPLHARAPQLRLAILCAIAIAVSASHLRTTLRLNTFGLDLVERRYVDVGRYVAVATPPNAVFITGLHGGSIRYYSGRLTLNIEQLQPRLLDRVVRSLTEMGYVPLIVLEDGERPAFGQRFGRDNELARLDWPPRHRTSEGVPVAIWDPADRQPFLNGAPVVTGDIQLKHPPTITQK